MRRDSALIISNTDRRAIKMMFNDVAPRADIVKACGKAIANIHNSAVFEQCLDRTGLRNNQLKATNASLTKSSDYTPGSESRYDMTLAPLSSTTIMKLAWR